ncbi:hypothetical protein S3E15_04463 [Bacillus mycoides]|uniref:Uncharacterized protein n=1 Tax=Bacillus mycoides TaxID=1405 RepID=A0AAP7W404_BACMY|nr:hypothetical protein S3E15_04463 [Bacillus mycoides]
MSLKEIPLFFSYFHLMKSNSPNKIKELVTGPATSSFS